MHHEDGVVQYSELIAWMQLTGVRLTLWEVDTMRILTREYSSSLVTLKDIKHPPPYLTKKTGEQLQKAHSESRLLMARNYNQALKNKAH